MSQQADVAASAAATIDPNVSGRPRQGLLTPAIVLGMLLAMQLYLVSYKSFNWDEFLHYSQVYLARNGTLAAPFQVLHSRILFWAPYAAESLVDQMRLARLFMWGCTLVTLAAIYGLARQFTCRVNSLYAAIAYLTAGYVFTQSFSIRADPMAAATLMSALYLFASGKLTPARAIAAGALIGLAGMITLKSVFYAPCFAGIAWWRYRQAGGKADILIPIAAMTMAALLAFAVIYWLHTSGLAAKPVESSSPASFMESGKAWFFSEDSYGQKWILVQAGWAFVFVLCIVLAPFGWRWTRVSASAQLALIGLVAPLLVLTFYRNTFPYFFVFLLAPVAVAIAPVLGTMRDRYGTIPMLALLALSPVVLTLREPIDVIDRQQAMIAYVKREFPRPVSYLARSGEIANYPRALVHLTASVGMNRYHERGKPIIARKVEAGQIAFVLANHPNIEAALNGKPLPRSFLQADANLLNDNFVQQWGPLYRAAKAIPAGDAPHRFKVPSSGPYTLEGERLLIDGQEVVHGQTIVLAAGEHEASGPRANRTVLWRGERLPSPPPMEWDGPFYTRF